MSTQILMRNWPELDFQLKLYLHMWNSLWGKLPSLIVQIDRAYSSQPCRPLSLESLWRSCWSYWPIFSIVLSFRNHSILMLIRYLTHLHQASLTYPDLIIHLDHNQLLHYRICRWPDSQQTYAHSLASSSFLRHLIIWPQDQFYWNHQVWK